MANKKSEKKIIENTKESQIDGIIKDKKEGAEERPPDFVSVPINKIIPNRIQAKFILPPDIEEKFYSKELNCFEAGEEFIRLAETDSIINYQLMELVRLGKSIAEIGQILPVVGAWQQSEHGEVYFDLYLGLRRFWGVVLYALQNKDEGNLKMLALEVDKSKVADMPVLNTHLPSLSAIEKIRAIAGLLLSRTKMKREEGESDLEHFRKVLRGRKYSKKIWKEVEDVFGVERELVKQRISFLQMTDKMQYFAAAADISEKELKELAGKDETEQLAEIQRIFSEKSGRGGGEESFDETAPLVTKSEPELLAEVVLEWFELTAERGTEKDFLDVAVLLFKQVGDARELEMIARRLINLARDIRVAKTRM